MNDHDCGFFTVAYVEHIITHRHMNFNQKDMWYYRAKVVHDMYLQQMHAHRLFALLLEVVLDGPLYALTAGCLLLIVSCMIMAYFQMSIGWCPQLEPSWKDIQFSLFKPWQERLNGQEF
eukprot:TRINITY_DN5796_c1_g1_i12.p2 TRINITY_DN5796_c1_g1~~TRINITY_DN5796_c1_g1_i12.p2  ORF type:complete len:119 (-),score=7.09 TRINITY_DN5796_c1_g1_i12:400-756(-)